MLNAFLVSVNAGKDFEEVDTKEIALKVIKLNLIYLLLEIL
jgi:hypothetical protein